MSKALPRRAFLKAMAALPAVAEQIEQAAVGAIVGPAATDGAALSALSTSPAIPGLGIGKNAEILALAKAGILPDWFKRMYARNARYGPNLDPDVSALRSVSLGSKLRITAERRERTAIDNFERDLIDQKLHAEFMGWPT